MRARWVRGVRTRAHHHHGLKHDVAEVDLERLAPDRDGVHLAPGDVGVDGHDLAVP